VQKLRKKTVFTRIGRVAATVDYDFHAADIANFHAVLVVFLTFKEIKKKTFKTCK